MSKPTDWIQQAIFARAEELGISAYSVAKKCEPPLDPTTVKRYFNGRCRLNSEYVGRICKVLGLRLLPARTFHQNQPTITD